MMATVELVEGPAELLGHGIKNTVDAVVGGLADAAAKGLDVAANALSGAADAASGAVDAAAGAADQAPATLIDLGVSLL